MKVETEIEIKLDSVQEGLKLRISSKKDGTLFDGINSAIENNEARFQLVEGCYYDYSISDVNYILGDIGDNIIQQHKHHSSIGTIAPNIYVGTLEIPLLKKDNREKCKSIKLEVQSVKTGYREDYRDMLELITEKCTDLLLQSNSPVSHHFDVDNLNDSQSLYQKFAFISSIINSEEFKDAVHRIVIAPTTTWSETHVQSDIRKVRRFSNKNLKELAKGSKRTSLPNEHYLRTYGLKNLPERITSIRKIDSVDTPENRFIKHALERFLKFCTDINKVSTVDSKLEKESTLLISKLESHLHHSIFKEISRPTTLKLNSPILQRKEGYREVLRAWLMFKLAAKLVWKGGEDVYGAGKKDIATLYEYWLFFKLLDLFQDIFHIQPKDISDLMEESDNGLNLRLKQGRSTALKGVFESDTRKFYVQFNYNRSFSGKKKYPDSGSWTTTLRPDYTLSFWPYGISESNAEKQELIVHIHFDAKYKIANHSDFIKQNITKDLDEEKIDNKKGVYKNADLLKMHAYKDAIRRTGGAYVLYPGDKGINRKGFHEIIPGLGAFPVRPSKNDDGIIELKTFILKVLDHFINRASQREKIAFRTFDIYKTPPQESDIVNEPLPEPYNNNRSLLPDETFVLVGYCKSNAHLEWIKSKLFYNFRTNNNKGALKLTKETLNAKYLLLHMAGDSSTSRIFKIKKPVYRITSKKTLERIKYPNPSQENYLVVKLEPCLDIEFKNLSWNFRNLKKYKSGRASAIPFTIKLSELMLVKIK